MFIWVVSVTIAFTLSRFTGLPVLGIYAMVQAADMLKCVIGFILVKKRRMASEHRLIEFLKSSGRGASREISFWHFQCREWKKGCLKSFHQLEKVDEI